MVAGGVRRRLPAGGAVVGRRPEPRRAFELVGVHLVAEGRDALGGDLQAHDADDPAVEHRHDGGGAVGGRGVDLGRTADDGALGVAGLEQAPHELRDREGSLERPRARRDLAAAVADRDGVAREQPYERLGPAAGGGREELLDDPLGLGLADLGAGLAVGDVLLGAVEDLLAGGLADVEDLGDLPVRVVEGLPEDVHRALVGGEALHDGEDGVRDGFALLGGVGGAEHRVADEERLGQPLADVGLAPGAGRGELVEAQVGEDLRQPGLGDLDALDVGGLPAQERVLHGVLGLARGAEEAVGDRLQAGPGGLEPVHVVQGQRHGSDPSPGAVRGGRSRGPPGCRGPGRSGSFGVGVRVG